jgi:uncharacterized membrane protein
MSWLRGDKTGLLIVLSIIGIIDSGYLTYKYWISTTAVSCSLTGGCNYVLSSSYASLFNIPLAAYGLIYYLLMLGLLVWFAYKQLNFLRHLIMFVVTIGMVVSIYLIYLQAIVIEYWCQFCLLSALTTTLIFLIMASTYLPKRSID